LIEKKIKYYFTFIFIEGRNDSKLKIIIFYIYIYEKLEINKIIYICLRISSIKVLLVYIFVNSLIKGLFFEEDSAFIALVSN